MLAEAQARRYWLEGLERTVAPAVSPITPAEVITHANLDPATPTPYLQTLIDAAVDVMERDLGRALISQTFKLNLDDLPQARATQRGRQTLSDAPDDNDPTAWSRGTGRTMVELPRPPLQSVTSWNTYDNAGAATLIPATSYLVDTRADPGRIVLLDGFALPSGIRAGQGLEIIFVAGYGAAAANVPPALRLALLQLVAHLYACRGDSIDSCDAWPASAWALASRFRVGRL